jgi:hypothetical protein
MDPLLIFFYLITRPAGVRPPLPCGIALIEEGLTQAEKISDRTPLPPLHKGHTIPCEYQAGDPVAVATTLTCALCETM